MTTRTSSHRLMLVVVATAGLILTWAGPASAGNGNRGDDSSPETATVAGDGIPHEDGPGEVDDEGGDENPTPVVIATGLNNPRQLSFNHDDIYVAEAGTGGTGPCMTGPEGDEVCFGTTGSITKITENGHQRRVLTGLPSIAGKADGSRAIGPSDVLSTSRKTLSVLTGLGGNVDSRAALPEAAATMGTIQRVDLRSGRSRVVADLAAYEASANPVGEIDSNPVGMARDRRGFVIADAGGNDVVKIDASGAVSTIATFPDTLVDAPAGAGQPAGGKIPMQAVPTSTTRGPDGAWYVSQLTGFPFPVGGASIYRIGRDGAVTVYASGLTNVTDLAFHDRTLYAVEIATRGLLAGPTGALVRVEPGSTSPIVVAGDLFAPYGLAIHDDDAYVTTGSVARDAGAVVRIALD